VSPHAPRAQPYAALQRALIMLLAANCAFYALHGAAREAADSIAWFALLVLFYSESAAQPRSRRALVTSAIRYARLGAAAAVAAAAWAYIDAAAWMDAANSAMWIAVVVLLEAQVRYPALVLRRRAALAVIGALLYGGLCLLPLAWLAQREWLAAYDATLWLAAFATIEADLLSADRPRQAKPTRMPREMPR
jgi:hypothetical protein